MTKLAAFWAWAKTRTGAIIVLASIVAAVVVIAMLVGRDFSQLYDTILRLVEIIFRTSGVG